MTVPELSDQLAEDFARAQPFEATLSGIDTYDDQWGDLSPEGHADLEAMLRDYQRRFEAFRPTGDKWTDHSLAVALAFLEKTTSSYDDREYLRDLNSAESTIQNLRQVFDVMDTDTHAGWEAIAARLEGLPAAMDAYMATLEAGRREGLAVARRQVLAAQAEAEVSAGDSSFFLTLPGVLVASGVTADGLADRIDRAVPKAQASFGKFADYLGRDYLPSAAAADAVGAERYESAAYRFTGTHLDLADTYEWGWDQLHGLSDQANQVAAEIDPDRSLVEVMQLLKTDPERAARSPQQFVDIMQQRQDQAVSDLADTHFDIPDAMKVVTVQLAPKGGFLGAYYLPPTEDFTRPGSIWYSVGDQSVFPLYDEISTAYHEGFPGHHLQVAYTMLLREQLSRLSRTFAWWSGSGEGWALYAERLMGELGYFEKPDYSLGMLINHLFRACRVVIDIGSHAEFRIPDHSPVGPGEEWSFEAAVELLRNVAFLDDANARSEVTRYLGWPGQAISYKMGERTILQLRDEKRQRGDESFSLREFHTQVLSAGSVGLDLLSSFVLDQGDS